MSRTRSLQASGADPRMAFRKFCLNSGPRGEAESLPRGWAGQCVCGAGPLPDQAGGQSQAPCLGRGSGDPRGSERGALASRGQPLAQLLPWLRPKGQGTGFPPVPSRAQGPVRAQTQASPPGRAETPRSLQVGPQRGTGVLCRIDPVCLTGRGPLTGPQFPHVLHKDQPRKTKASLPETCPASGKTLCE